MIDGVATEGERLKYLDLLQATISRQAANTFVVKGWSLTVAAAFYGYVATHLSVPAALVALLPTMGFYYLDAFYLRQERLFRALWADVIGNTKSIQLFTMDTTTYKAAYPSCRWRNVLFRSWHLTGLYGMILVVGISVLARAIAK